MKKVDHRYIVRRRVVTDIHERQNVIASGFIGEKLFHSIRPLILFGFGNFRVAVPGQVRQDKLAEIEIVDESGSARRIGSSREFFHTRERIDERTFPDV